MTPTSNPPPKPRWPVVIFAILAAVFLGPLLLRVFFAGLALTFGFAVFMVKLGLVALAVLFAVKVFKSLFGPRRPPVPASQMTIDATPEIDPNAELERIEREHREHLAELDRQLQQAMAQSDSETK